MSERLGAVDLGTNSFHMIVAEVADGGSLRTVAKEKVMLRLGDAVASTGRIDAASEDRAVDALRRLHELAKVHGASTVTALATSAIREAENGVSVVRRLRDETGLDVEVISGEQEARLIFRALQGSIDMGGRTALGFDIGGGSVEFMLGAQTSLSWLDSLRLGVGRLTAQFVHSDPVGRKERAALDTYVRRAIEPVTVEALRHGFGLAIGSSGTILALAALVAAERGDTPESMNGYRVDIETLRDVCAMLARSKLADRLVLERLEAKRADLMPAAAVLVTAILDLFEIGELAVSTWGLREGIVLREVAHPAFLAGDPARIRHRAVLTLGRTHGFDELHGRQTARLAGALFDVLHVELGVDSSLRGVLDAAVLIHDVGMRIALRGHHKHSAYLVRHADLPGFEPDDRALLTALVRYHRSGRPKDEHEEYQALPVALRPVLLPLVAVLRVADGLDRSKAANVLGIDVSVRPDHVLIRLTSTSGDPGLDLWGARSKADLLEEVLGRPVVFAGPADVLASARD